MRASRGTTRRVALRHAASVFLCAVAAVAAEGGVCPPPPPTAGEIPRLRFADLLCPATPACPPDLNGDTAVDVFDLLSFLDAWFALESTADLNTDTVVDVFDLLQYLDLWFDGCP